MQEKQQHTQSTYTSQNENGLIKRKHYQNQKIGKEENISKKLEEDIPFMILKDYFKETSPSKEEIQQYQKRQNKIFRYIYS